jgi:hypothetical protein
MAVGGIWAFALVGLSKRLPDSGETNNRAQGQRPGELYSPICLIDSASVSIPSPVVLCCLSAPGYFLTWPFFIDVRQWGNLHRNGKQSFVGGFQLPVDSASRTSHLANLLHPNALEIRTKAKTQKQEVCLRGFGPLRGAMRGQLRFSFLHVLTRAQHTRVHFCPQHLPLCYKKNGY